MKQILPLLFLCLSANIIMAQITVTSASFPQAGDTLRTSLDNFTNGIVVGDPGANLNWDFTSLKIPFVQEVIFRDASEGDAAASFPNATMVTEIQIGDSLAEAYFRSDDDKFEQLGYVGTDPLNLGLNLLVKLSPPLTERNAPLKYGDFNSTESAVTLPFASSDLPPALLDSLPITPDSLRLRLNTNRVDIVDAWGALTIPGGFDGETYEVLREKRTEIRTIRLDVKVSILPWQDITDLLTPELREFGKDTTTTYNFFSNEAKEPIAIVTVDNTTEEVIDVVFKANDITSSVVDFRQIFPGISAYPNPTSGEVQFEIKEVEAGDYKIKVYNLLGAEVWSKEYYIPNLSAAKKEIITVDLSDFKRGLYLFSLIDANGKKLNTKRLIISN